jgi:hypothetical protein
VVNVGLILNIILIMIIAAAFGSIADLVKKDLKNYEINLKIIRSDKDG